MEDEEGNLDNPHRHAKALMPYVPQEVLAELAVRAHLGEVLDVRVDRESTEQGRGGLHAYLMKQSRMYLPAHPMLSSYFAKQAARPDTFNALPKGAARVRINYPVSRPEKPKLPAGSFAVLDLEEEEVRRLHLPWTLPRDHEDFDTCAHVERGCSPLDCACWAPDFSVAKGLDRLVRKAEQLEFELGRPPPSHDPRPL